MRLQEAVFTTNLGQLNLFELFHAIDRGESVELLRMQPHQRAPIATALAIIMVALRKYATTNPVDWESEWASQTGDLPLYAESIDKPAFMQPPLEQATPISLSSLEMLFAGDNHEYKERSKGEQEDYILALLVSPWKGGVRYWYSTSGREMRTVVLPSIDGSFGSEVNTLIQSYVTHPEFQAKHSLGRSAMDHFLWTDPWLTGESIDRYPYPLSSQRAVRICAEGAVGQKSLDLKRRITKGQHFEDPHAPLLGGTPIKLWGTRKFNVAFQHACLFGAAQYGSDKLPCISPPILRSTNYQYIRLCAYGSEMGKTLGYWEETYTLKTEQKLRFRKSLESRASELSVRALGALKAVEDALKKSLCILMSDKSFRLEAGSDSGKIEELVWARVNSAISQFSAGAAHGVTQRVLDLLAEERNAEDEQKILTREAFAVASKVYAQYESSCRNPLQRAVAYLKFNDQARKLAGDASVTAYNDTFPLVQQTYAVINSLQSMLTPQDRAQLRTMNYTNPPLSYWSLLAEVPITQAEFEKTESVWRSIISALGVTRSGKRSLGRALRSSKMPEARVQQLLMATGPRLVELIRETVRWLVAHDTESADLATLCSLGLADALRDRETLEHCRKRIALDYVRKEFVKKTPDAEEEVA